MLVLLADNGRQLEDVLAQISISFDLNLRPRRVAIDAFGKHAPSQFLGILTETQIPPRIVSEDRSPWNPWPEPIALPIRRKFLAKPMRPPEPQLDVVRRLGRIDGQVKWEREGAEKNDEAADGESGDEVVAAGNSIGKKENGVGFKRAGVIQNRVLADVGLDFGLGQRTE